MSDMALEAEVDEFDPQAALERALTAMKERENEDRQNRKYVDGDHPRLSWVTKIKKIFGQSVADQIHQANYCAKAVNGPLSRMRVTGFTDPTFEELVKANGVYLTQRDLYSDAIIIDSGYVVIAEGEGEGPEAPPYDIVVQRAEDCYVEMGSLKPGDRKFGVKVTADPDLGDEGGYRAWVWDRTTYWRFVAAVGDPSDTPRPESSAFTVDAEDPTGPHGFDRVPLVPFRLGRDPKSRIAALRPVQDRIDMLEVMKVVAGTFGASRQRVFFTSQEMSEEDTEASPDFAIVLDPGNSEDGEASVTEFQHTPLENYDKAIDAEIDRFYEIGELAKHGRQNPGGQASGEAIKADDGPFIAMCGDYVESFEAAWVELAAMLGIETEVTWRDLETRDEHIEITSVKTAVDAGIPLETALTRYAHFTEDDLVEMRKAKKAQDAAAHEAREAALLAAEQDRDVSDLPSFEE